MSNHSHEPVRGKVLREAAAATLGDRNKTYGDPYTDMELVAKLRNLYDLHAQGKYCKAHDEAMHRVFIKIARIAAGAPGHLDNYIDGAAYFGIAAECQAEHVNQPQFPFGQLGEGAPRSLSDEKILKKQLEEQMFAGAGSTIRPDDKLENETTGPLLERPQPVTNINQISEGTLFRIHGEHPKSPKDIWVVEKIIMPSLHTFSARNTNDPGHKQMLHIRAISEIVEAQTTKSNNLRCVHCPNDAMEGSALCQECEDDTRK